MPRPFTLHEITTLLKTNNILGVSAIVIQPPSNPSVSDEDSGDEEGGTIYNLPKSLMREPAYLVQYDDEFEFDDFLYTPKDNSFDADLPSITTVPKRKKMTIIDRKWEKTDLTAQPVSGRVTQQPFDFFNEARTPTEIFELFLDDDVIELVVECSNAYAENKGVTLDLTSSEFKCFLGIIFMSGYMSLPRRRMLWEPRKDTHNPLVCSAMTHDRFEAIFSNLYVADYFNLDSSDKFAKLRPLINKLNDRCMKFVPNERYFNLDEIMVPYYGRHEYGRYIDGKPIRFGYKFWCAATRLGYVCWFQPHQDNKHEKYDEDDSPVVQFSETLTKAHPGQYHFVLNIFTSISILDKLSSMGHQATGRVSKNRTEKAPLESNVILRTKEIGNFDYRTDDKGNILCKWNDNRIITVASSGAGIEPLNPVNGFSEKLNKTIEVQQPNLIKVYNTFKGGVNRADKNIDKYRASIRGKKWYSSPLLFCFELMLQNAWQLHTINDKQQMDLLEFRRRVANHYLETHAKFLQRKTFSDSPFKTVNIDLR